MIIKNDQTKCSLSLPILYGVSNAVVNIYVPQRECQSPQFGDIWRRTLTGGLLPLYSTMYLFFWVIVRHVLLTRARMPTTHWRVLWKDHCRMMRSVKTLSFHARSQ